MATRCNIIVKDKHNELIFYKHWDGYPEGVLPILEPLMEKVKAGKLRDNVGQFSGHLITSTVDTSQSGWQAAEIEPTYCIHGDIEFLYVFDLDTKEIFVEKIYGGSDFTYKGKYRQESSV